MPTCGAGTMTKKLLLAVILFQAAPCWGTITRTQLAGSTSTSTSAVAVTMSSTVAGHLIVCEMTTRSNGQTLGISDNKGNVYTAFPSVFTTNIWNNGHASTDQIWYTIDSFGAVTTITMTHTTGAANMGVCGEYSSTNGWPSNPRDAIGAVNSSGGLTTWTSGTSPSITQASELLWGCVAFVAAPGTITPGASWGVGVNETTGADTLYCDDRIVTSISTYAYTGSYVNTVDRGAVMVTFKDNLNPPGAGIGGKAGMGGKAGIGYWQPIWRRSEELQ